MSNILKNCKCGCGKQVRGTWAKGHNRKGTTFKLSDEAKEKIRQAQLSHNSMTGKIPWNKDKKMAESTRQKVIQARANQIITAEHRKSIGASLKKLWESGELKKEEWWIWKGDRVGYSGLHKRIRQELGSPDTCEHCGKSGLKGNQIHWANKSGEYRYDHEDWLRLCVACHRNYDMGRNSIALRFAQS